MSGWPAAWAAIPAELRALAQWVMWRLEKRGGKVTKVPYNPRTGTRAASDNPRTWGSFDAALRAFELGLGRYSGLGFVFSDADPYFGVDLDKCRDPETGAIEPWALAIVERLDSYAEISPSGRGLHIIVRGKLPPGRRRKGRIEMYDSLRFFTVTGNRLEASS